MVIGYHVVFSTYGFWLPNDPRGSGSKYVGSRALLAFGPATAVQTRRSVARRPHDNALRLSAKEALARPPARFSGLQARAVGRGFGEFVTRHGLAIWACAILPQHVHLVLGRHRYSVEQVVILLKGAATRRLLVEGLHPFGVRPLPGGRVPSVWGRGVRKVFLDDWQAVARSIEYVEQNPVREGLPPQRWSFVTSYVSE